MSVSYTLKESIAGFRRNRANSMISIFTVSISLLLLGIFTVITINFSSLVSKIRSRVEIEVFLKDGISPDQQKQTGIKLQRIPGVQEAAFISKDDAKKIFEEEIGESFHDILEDNPLPTSYRLSISEGYDNADSVRVIADLAGKIRTVENVVYRKQFLSLIDKRARAFRYATLFIGIILAVSAIILVANTIRLTIYAKREIIRTMKLVGATPTFIRFPFLIEGILHGLIGGIIASVLIDLVFGVFLQPLSEDLLLSIDINFGFYLFLIFTGCVLGLLGSVVSIRRFLKEALVAPI